MNLKINREKNQKIWFTSDLHFYHKNICGPLSTWENAETARPFDDIEKMNEFIINQINSVVTNHDYLFILGDLCFGSMFDKKCKLTNRVYELYELMKKMNGIKYVIKGNHDNYQLLNLLRGWKLIEDWYEYLELKTQYIENKRTRKVNIVAMHYPILEWNGKANGTIMLTGHSHHTLNYENYGLSNSKIKDVGIDNKNYIVYNLDEIMEGFEDKTNNCLDHHTE